MAPPVLLNSCGPTAGPRVPAVTARPSLHTVGRVVSVRQAALQTSSRPHEHLETRSSTEEERAPSTTSKPCATEPVELAAPFARTSFSQGSQAASSAAYAKDQNSVTIKAFTPVKDSAGAIMKVLERLSSTIVIALQQDAGHESLNRAVKALAVARKYMTDNHPELELSFFPVHRSDCWGQVDGQNFAFVAFKSLLQPAADAAELKECDLHVSSNSDPGHISAQLVRVVLEHGQAVMKAGGGCALFLAMTAVIQARQCLKAFHAMDVALVPQWITEDTRATLGRESKFLQFRILPSGLCGVLPDPAAARQPAILPIPPAL